VDLFDPARDLGRHVHALPREDDAEEAFVPLGQDRAGQRGGFGARLRGLAHFARLWRLPASAKKGEDGDDKCQNS